MGGQHGHRLPTRVRERSSSRLMTQHTKNSIAATMPAARKLPATCTRGPLSNKPVTTLHRLPLGFVQHPSSSNGHSASPNRTRRRRGSSRWLSLTARKNRRILFPGTRAAAPPVGGASSRSRPRRGRWPVRRGWRPCSESTGTGIRWSARRSRRCGWWCPRRTPTRRKREQRPSAAAAGSRPHVADVGFSWAAGAWWTPLRPP